MKTYKIYWQEAIKILRLGNKILQENIDFNNEFIHWKIVEEFNEFGFRVPKELINYDDDNIDFTDITELNEITLKNGTYQFV